MKLKGIKHKPDKTDRASQPRYKGWERKEGWDRQLEPVTRSLLVWCQQRRLCFKKNYYYYLDNLYSVAQCRPRQSCYQKLCRLHFPVRPEFLCTLAITFHIHKPHITPGFLSDLPSPLDQLQSCSCTCTAVFNE